jgi:AraC-like DNA-binding protein
VTDQPSLSYKLPVMCGPPDELQTGDWTAVAQDCGYFDQSHLIRECRQLSGFTPTELAARRIGDSNHWVQP